MTDDIQFNMHMLNVLYCIYAFSVHSLILQVQVINIMIILFNITLLIISNEVIVEHNSGNSGNSEVISSTITSLIISD